MIYTRELVTFQNAYKHMLQGGRARRKDWKGYWYWSDKLNSIVIHMANGEEFDIRKTDDVKYTMSNILADDWEVAYVD